MRFSAFTKLKLLLVFVLLIAITAGTVWFVRGRDGRGRQQKPQNIFLISIDTIRADRLSCYGYRHKTTPNIDAFAGNAVLFENCFSNIPLTLPAHSSMLTGLIPPAHGVQDNLGMSLSDSILTLPEILQAEGYSTYGIISAEVLGSFYGLNQGFDVYDDTFDEVDSVQLVVQRTGDETTDHAIKWLEENQDEKKFMFIHFYDPHSDYLPPAPFDKLFQGPYDGEIAFVDHCIGTFIDKLKSLGQYDDSLIIVTGDHAELLGEHDEPEHGYFIYQNVLRVPLIVKPAGHVMQIRVADNTTLTDIMPTILAQGGHEIPEPIHGVDLSGYFAGSGYHITKRFLFNECLTATKYNGNSLLGIINDQWHYIQTTRPELYDRVADPGELNNLIYKEPKRARYLKKQLADILDTCVSAAKESDSGLNFESREALKSLGYVGGSVDTDVAFDQKREDPKDLIRIHTKVSKVMVLTHDEDYDEAISLCKEIIAKRPDIAPVYEVFADIYIRLEEYDKAIELAKKKLTIVPGDLNGIKYLAETYRLAGMFPEAIGQINIVLEKNPNDMSAYDKLADIYMQLKQYDKTIEVLQKKLALSPEDIATMKYLAETYKLAGDYPQATKYIYLVMEKTPEDPAGYDLLADIYSKQKKFDKAIESLQKKLALLPGDINTLKFLATTCYLAGDHSQAVSTIKEILKQASDDAQTYLHLAKNYYRLKDYSKALESYLKALKLDPELSAAHIGAGEAYKKAGDLKLAVEHYEIGLSKLGDLFNIHNTVGWIQATSKDPELYDPESALVHAQKAIELSKDVDSPAYKLYPYFLDTLAAAQSANGDFEAAIESASLAIKLCREKELDSVADEIQKHLDLYKQRKVYRE